MSTHTPKRIQLRRTKGWRKPEGAIVVARPSKWGNPFVIGSEASVCVRGDDGVLYDFGGIPMDASLTVAMYRAEWEARLEPPLAGTHADDVEWWREQCAEIETLRGHDLCCWCDLSSPCHADVLLELANR